MTGWEWLGFACEVVILICLPCSLIDMGMNGARYAGFAPFGATASAVALGVMWLIGFY